MGISKSFALVIGLVFLTASSITILQPVKAQIENVATSASITVQTEKLLYHQYFQVSIQIHPPPPTLNDVFQNLSLTLESPAQGTIGQGPFNQGPFSTDANGSRSFSFLITSIGTWNVYLHFPGQFFANDTIYYQPGDWETNVSVSPTPAPSPSMTPSPLPSTTLTPSPSIPEFPSWTIPLPLSMMVAFAGLLVYFKKRKR